MNEPNWRDSGTPAWAVDNRYIGVSTRLRQVLAGIQFPVERWQLIAWAQHYGADYTTLRELEMLPPSTFRCMEQVVARVLQAAGPQAHAPAR